MTVFSANPTTGVGALQAVPAPTPSGTPLGVMPDGAIGARLYLPTGSSVTFTVAGTAPLGPPSSVFVASGAGTGPNWDEPLAGGQMLYITSVSGSPLYRWF